MFPTRLTTPNLTLRQPGADDLPAYRSYCASDRARFVGGPFGAAQAFEKLAAMIGHWALRGFGRYVIDWKGAPIGHVGPMQLDAATLPELTWTLWDAQAEGRGLATEAARAAAGAAFAAGMDELRIHVAPDNLRSARLAERLGAIRLAVSAPAYVADHVVYALRNAADDDGGMEAYA